MPIPKTEDTAQILVGGSKMKRDRKDNAKTPERLVKVVKLWEERSDAYERLLRGEPPIPGE